MTKVSNKFLNVATNMKRIIIIFALCFPLIFLISCDYEIVLYDDYVREETEVVKVELITYDIDDTEIYIEMEVFNTEYLSIISILDTEVEDNFLSDLSSIGGIGSKPKDNINCPYGYGIKITYIDDGFTIITVSTVLEKDIMYVGHFNSELNLEYYNSFIWDEVTDSFNDLLFEYFEYSV
jgi:hypothetical protein